MIPEFVYKKLWMLLFLVITVVVAIGFLVFLRFMEIPVKQAVDFEYMLALSKNLTYGE